MPSDTVDSAPRGRRVLVLGATGTIGRATVRALADRGHEVVCFVRPRAQTAGAAAPQAGAEWPEGVTLRSGDITDPASFARFGLCGERFDALVSCMASRTGAPKDAWAIDCRAHSLALASAKAAGIPQMVLVSAICVQKPLLEFQKAKLAFEAELIASGLIYSIVRPTAFFKSLSGQVERLKRGKPFVMFGDGELTACKPISDEDLGEFIAGCLDDPARQNTILPIGGPGEAITPREQGEHLFKLMRRKPKFKRVPVAMLDGVIAVLGALGPLSPWLRDKAELARIGRYYATESMLVYDPDTGRYDAAATPSFGSHTLFDFYARLLKGEASVDRGDHAVF